MPPSRRTRKIGKDIAKRTHHHFGVFSQAGYSELRRRYGASAATTYESMRERGEPAAFAFRAMQDQLAALGPGYGGGLACVPYRQRRSTRS